MLKARRAVVGVVSGSLLFWAMAGTGAVQGTAGAAKSGELDCNGYSTLQTPVHDSFPCMEIAGNDNYNGFLDNGWYLGHDEPAQQFLSSKAGSGNSAQYKVTLPTEPALAPNGTISGSVWDYQLQIATWFGMVMCDTQSYPEGSTTCTPDSDSNIQVPPKANHAGAAYMELQFYPPGWSPFISQISCDQIHWCVAVTIDSLQASYGFANENLNCIEPVNFAFLTLNGQPVGPPGPDTANNATFTPTPEVLEMNEGDNLVVSMHDTSAGFLTQVQDVSTGQSGSMVASDKNGFRQILWDPVNHSCNGQNYSFHPMYSTAAGPVNYTDPNTGTTHLEPQTWATWTAHTYNVAFTSEIGHFETPDRGSQSGEGKMKEEGPCFSGPTIPGCIGSDVPDFDGFSYQKDWPDGTGTRPTPFYYNSPLSLSKAGSYSNGYSQMAFEADLPRLEVPALGGTCNRSTGAGCTNPPPGANFYPWFHEATTATGCRYTISDDLPNQISNYGGEVSSYGGLEMTSYGFASRFNNYSSGPQSNSCP